MARPKIEIDEKTFKKLCTMQATLEEIAGFFECSEDTIERWCKRTYNKGFADTYKKYAASGKISLRRYQFQLAEKSPAMAIFLGKNYLGQTDKYEMKEKNNGILDELKVYLSEGKEEADSDVE